MSMYLKFYDLEFYHLYCQSYIHWIYVIANSFTDTSNTMINIYGYFL